MSGSRHGNRESDEGNYAKFRMAAVTREDRRVWVDRPSRAAIGETCPARIAGISEASTVTVVPTASEMRATDACTVTGVLGELDAQSW